MTIEGASCRISWRREAEADRVALLDMEDALDRVGGLAADGMHGLKTLPPRRSALSAYFELLAEKIEEMRGANPRKLR